jgi:hypothetical protein
LPSIDRSSRGRCRVSTHRAIPPSIPFSPAHVPLPLLPPLCRTPWSASDPCPKQAQPQLQHSSPLLVLGFLSPSELSRQRRTARYTIREDNREDNEKDYNDDDDDDTTNALHLPILHTPPPAAPIARPSAATTMMRKKESYSTVTPIPGFIPRQLAIDILHSHSEVITLNPLVISRELFIILLGCVSSRWSLSRESFVLPRGVYVLLLPQLPRQTPDDS